MRIVLLHNNFQFLGFSDEINELSMSYMFQCLWSCRTQIEVRYCCAFYKSQIMVMALVSDQL